MTWKRQRTTASIDVDVDLHQFDGEELLQGLIDAGWITEDEAEAIHARSRKNDRSQDVLAAKVHFQPSMPDNLMETAIDELRRGRVGEARIYLERYLGHDWAGVLAHG